jgi:hypothetical protein
MLPGSLPIRGDSTPRARRFPDPLLLQVSGKTRSGASLGPGDALGARPGRTCAVRAAGASRKLRAAAVAAAAAAAAGEWEGTLRLAGGGAGTRRGLPPELPPSV